MAVNKTVTETQLRAMFADLKQSVLDTVDRRIVPVAASAEKNRKYLFGNGDPGLDERVRNIETSVDDLKKKFTEWTNAVKWTAGIAGAYLIVEIVKLLLANL